MTELGTDELISAIESLIATFSHIFNGLSDLETEMSNFDTGKTLVKIAGTAANVTGAALAIGGAFFTFGMSAVVGGLIATAGGTATNMVTDHVDRKKSTECLNRIQTLLQDYKKKANQVKELSDQLDVMVKNMMRTYNISLQQAIVFGFGKGNSLGLQSISAIASSISKIQFTASEIRLVESLFSTSFAVSKTASMASTSSGITASAVNAGTKVIGGTIAKSAAVVNVVFVSFEVVNLAIDVFNDHPTVQKITEIRSKLRQEKSQLQTTRDDLKRLKKISEQQVKTAAMEEVKTQIRGLMKRNQRRRRSDSSSEEDEEDDDDEYVRTVRFTVRQEDLRNGTPISPFVRAFINSIGAPGDQVGHLRAKMFNGSGTDVMNFIPQKGNLNMGEFKSHELFVQSELKQNPGAHAEVVIHLYYRLKSTYPFRPFKIKYTFKIFCRGQPPFETSGCFIN